MCLHLQRFDPSRRLIEPGIWIYVGLGFKQMQEGFRYGNNLKLCGKEFVGLAICNTSFPLIRPESLVSWAPNLTAKSPGDSTILPGSIPEDSRICRFVKIPKSTGFG